MLRQAGVGRHQCEGLAPGRHQHFGVVQDVGQAQVGHPRLTHAEDRPLAPDAQVLFGQRNPSSEPATAARRSLASSVPGSATR